MKKFKLTGIRFTNEEMNKSADLDRRLAKAKREAGKGNAKGKNRYPLRKVVERGIIIEWMGHTPIYGNKLECGHIIRPARDFYGEIFSQRQRCRLCYAQQQECGDQKKE